MLGWEWLAAKLESSALILNETSCTGSAPLGMKMGFSGGYMPHAEIKRGDHRVGRGSDLSFRGAMNAGIGTACLPTIQIGLGLLQALKAFSLERSLSVADAGFK
jgi:hypothetical protein